MISKDLVFICVFLAELLDVIYSSSHLWMWTELLNICQQICNQSLMLWNSGVVLQRCPLCPCWGLEFPVCLTLFLCFHWVFPAHRIVINLFAFPANVAGLWPPSLSIDGWSNAGEDTVIILWNTECSGTLYILCNYAACFGFVKSLMFRSCPIKSVWFIGLSL